MGKVQTQTQNSQGSQTEPTQETEKETGTQEKETLQAISVNGYNALKEAITKIINNRKAYKIKGKREIETLQKFIDLNYHMVYGLTLYETTDNKLYCMRLYNDDKISLFNDKAKAYQNFAIQIIIRLVNKGIFTIKEFKDPRTKRFAKFICLNQGGSNE